MTAGGRRARGRALSFSYSFLFLSFSFFVLFCFVSPLYFAAAASSLQERSSAPRVRLRAARLGSARTHGGGRLRSALRGAVTVPEPGPDGTELNGTERAGGSKNRVVAFAAELPGGRLARGCCLISSGRRVGHVEAFFSFSLHPPLSPPLLPCLRSQDGLSVNSVFHITRRERFSSSAASAPPWAAAEAAAGRRTPAGKEAAAGPLRPRERPRRGGRPIAALRRPSAPRRARARPSPQRPPGAAPPSPPGPGERRGPLSAPPGRRRGDGRGREPAERRPCPAAGRCGAACGGAESAAEAAASRAVTQSPPRRAARVPAPPSAVSAPRRHPSVACQPCQSALIYVSFCC